MKTPEDFFFPGRVFLATVLGLFYCAAGCLGTRPAVAGEAQGAPQQVAPSPANEASIVRLPDGRLKVFWIEPGKHCLSMTSRDHGKSWSAPQVEFPVPAEASGTTQTLVDRQGQLHVCFLVCRGRGNRRHGVDLFYDIWHARTSGEKKRWTAPRRILAGYVGALRDLVQMRRGRILLPFGKWLRPSQSPTGANEVRVLWSDDQGRSWRETPQGLTVPVQPTGGRIGAVEPTLLELRGGKLWMLIRNDNHRLYQAFSDQGIRWTRPQPSRFASSESPAKLLRLPGGRILLIWNNCQELTPPPGKRYPAYSGRDVLHAALSPDEGRTWYGFREILRDPLRNQTPPRHGDRGTAYPDAVVADDGHVVVVSGQGAGRRFIFRFHPDWLLETSQEEDFSQGLDRWCVFRPFGPLKFVWRDRTQGARLVPHPRDASRRVLQLRTVSGQLPDGAVWNFPLGRRGVLRLRAMMPLGSAGGSVALTDRFFDPCDDQGEKRAVFLLRLAPKSRPGAISLPPGRWNEIALRWDLPEATCRVEVNGRRVAALPLRRDALHGLCYLRLRSASPGPSPGWMVQRVQVKLDLAGGATSQSLRIGRRAVRHRSHTAVFAGGPGRDAR